MMMEIIVVDFNHQKSRQADTNIQGREGVVIVKTTQALLVTHYPETVQPGAATNTVETLGDYLVKVGY
jgi:hypothetical protein